jgi:hypothetical protein
MMQEYYQKYVGKSSSTDDFRKVVEKYFGKNQYAYTRVNVQSPSTQIQLPILPIKPEKIIFNAQQSVLCSSVEQSINYTSSGYLLYQHFLLSAQTNR